MDKFKIITDLKNELDSYRPLPPEAVKNLQDIYRVEWTYHSNAIEGNTLTLIETKLVLEEG
jgi:Fic family protein